MKLKTKFQDEDFELGEVVEADIFYGGPESSLKVETRAAKGCYHTFYCDSLKELNDLFEDYEEPKEHWCITMYGGITRIKDDEEPIDDLIEIGNYFNSKEDAYDALDKLKAWKRLKKCGLRFWDLDTVHLKIGYSFENYTKEDIPQLKKDLALIFGGEE